MGAYQCVNAIKEGCTLYKQAKESFIEIKETYNEVVGDVEELKGIFSFLISFFRDKLFGIKPKIIAVKPKVKQKQKYITVDETKIRSDVIQQLTKFFKLQEQLAEHIREEEYKSKNVYDKNQNYMESALLRVDALDQMAALEVTIRETMVYQSPPEMGALYSKVFDMRDVIKQEQDGARLKQEQLDRSRRWQQRKDQQEKEITIILVLLTLFLIGYLHLWFLYLSQ